MFKSDRPYSSGGEQAVHPRTSARLKNRLALTKLAQAERMDGANEEVRGQRHKTTGNVGSRRVRLLQAKLEPHHGVHPPFLVGLDGVHNRCHLVFFQTVGAKHIGDFSWTPR